MTVFDSLVGQQAVIGSLTSAVRDAADAAEPGPSMTHAWLFTGPPGSGRTTAARALATALQCAEGGCGQCAECRTVLAGTHPDVRAVYTEKSQIQVAQVREATAWAARAPAGGRWNVISIEDADRLNDSAASALLKMLEEPPARTVWLLAAPSTEDLLPTLQSRCRHVRLRTPTAGEVAEILTRRDGVDPAMAAFVARACQGHVGRARRLATDEGARLRRAEVLRLPLHLDRLGDCLDVAANLVEAASEEADAVSASREEQETADLSASLGVLPGSSRLPRGAKGPLDQLKKDHTARRKRLRRDSIDLALLDVLAFYRDVLAVQLTANTEAVHADLSREAAETARSSTAEATLRRIDAVSAARMALRETEANEQLVLESMAVALARAASAPKVAT